MYSTFSHIQKFYQTTVSSQAPATLLLYPLQKPKTFLRISLFSWSAGVWHLRCTIFPNSSPPVGLQNQPSNTSQRKQYLFYFSNHTEWIQQRPLNRNTALPMPTAFFSVFSKKCIGFVKTDCDTRHSDTTTSSIPIADTLFANSRLQQHPPNKKTHLC